MHSLFEYLEKSQFQFPNKIAFVEETSEISFRELYEKSITVGCYLHNLFQNKLNNPICIVGERGIDTLICMLGCLSSGNFYVIIDGSLPKARMVQMISSIQPLAVIETEDTIHDVTSEYEVINYKNIYSELDYNQQISIIKSIMKETHGFDPAYGVFTSGSTGTPKLVVKSHQSLLEFIDIYAAMFGYSDKDILGNQFPFYFDASTKDIFCCIKCGITTHIIPKALFSFPKELIQYIIEKNITKIVWVPSALTIVSNSEVFQYTGCPNKLNTVLFVGEQMPVKQLNYWKTNLPETKFYNIYGSTEVAGNFLYYEYTDVLENTKRLPTGKPFPNVNVFLLNENGIVNTSDVLGEICVAGNTLALGYYRNKELTDTVFIQNPTVFYREVIYKTGDLAYYDECGNVIWATRKDFQIKHMGYRIELSEIDTVIGALAGIKECCSVYDTENKRIILYYTANCEMKKEIGLWVRAHLPKYMFPGKYIRIESLPHNANGKIDRKSLMNTKVVS